VGGGGKKDHIWGGKELLTVFQKRFWIERSLLSKKKESAAFRNRKKVGKEGKGRNSATITF